MRIGLLGSDRDARQRVERYAARPDVEVAGVVTDGEPPPDWPSAPVYADVATLLAEADVDALDVRDRTRPQRPAVERTVDAGVDAICRAPLAADPARGTAIRDLAEQSESQVLVDAPHLFTGENRDAKSVVDDGRIGTATTVHTTRRLPGVEGVDLGTGGSTDAADGTVSSDAAALLRRAFYADFARGRWLIGDVERVFTRLRQGSGSSGPFCQAVAVARFDSGAVGHHTVSYGDRHDEVSVVAEYSGTDGRYTYDSETFTPLSVRSETPTGVGLGAAFERPRPSLDSHDAHVDALLAALRGTAEPPESLGSAVETLRTVHAATESARRDVPVPVGEGSA